MDECRAATRCVEPEPQGPALPSKLLRRRADSCRSRHCSYNVRLGRYWRGLGSWRHDKPSAAAVTPLIVLWLHCPGTNPFDLNQTKKKQLRHCRLAIHNLRTALNWLIRLDPAINSRHFLSYTSRSRPTDNFRPYLTSCHLRMPAYASTLPVSTALRVT